MRNRLRLCLLFLSILSAGASLARAEDIGGDFTLLDHNRQVFELKQLRGKVALLFFGYTHCPDVCPTELAGIAQLLRVLGPDRDQVQGLFVSVDPARDTPEQLKAYVEYFSPDLIGLSGSEQQLRVIKEAYHVQSSVYREKDSESRYTVDHTANLYVIDQQGKLASIVPYGFPIDHVLKVVEDLLL